MEVCMINIYKWGAGLIIESIFTGNSRASGILLNILVSYELKKITNIIVNWQNYIDDLFSSQMSRTDKLLTTHCYSLSCYSDVFNILLDYSSSSIEQDRIDIYKSIFLW